MVFVEVLTSFQVIYAEIPVTGPIYTTNATVTLQDGMF